MNVVISGHMLAIILTAIVAGSKNRSVFRWLILSLFLSWIAFIIVLILPTKYRWR
jgi:Kef-type K+ transport system membrane component KefB